MEKIFSPKSVAIVGASNTKGKIGNILIKNLKNNLNEIKIFPVNPKGGLIENIKSYTSVLEIEKDVDLAVIAVPAKFVNKVVEECAWREEPIKNIIIISAGFGESGKEGESRKEELQGLIEKYNLNILGPNCLGIINTKEGINLSFAKKEIIAGGIGLISQSGAFITSMIDTELGFSLVASLGNKININENELLDYYARDKNTKIIALYLEGISDGIKFRKKLEEITKIKPVVIIKAGRTNKTQQAIQSHTGSMAGESAVVKEVIKDAGGILIDNLEDFVTILRLLNNFSRLQSKNLVIVTNAGGPGVITTDLIENSTLELFEFDKKHKENLQSNLPEESSVNNPIDLLGDAQEDRYQIAFEILKKIDGIGGVLALITPQSQTPIEKIIEVIVEANRNSVFPIFPLVIGGAASKKAEIICAKLKINNFKFPVTLIRALNGIQLSVHSSQLNNKLGKDNEQGLSVNKMHLDDKMENSVEENNKVLLSYKDSEKISKEFNLNTLPAEYPENISELRQSIDKLKLPIVMKVDSPNIIHKNERNGVVVGLDTIEKSEIEFERFQKDFSGERILIQHQVETGLEIILGLKRDKSFGLVLIIGLGGITTEILNEKILFVDEVTREMIIRKLKISKLNKILKKEKIDMENLVDQAEKLFKLGQVHKEIEEVDVNPMFFYPDKKPVIVDFKIMVNK